MTVSEAARNAASRWIDSLHAHEATSRAEAATHDFLRWTIVQLTRLRSELRGMALPRKQLNDIAIRLALLRSHFDALNLTPARLRTSFFSPLDSLLHTTLFALSIVVLFVTLFRTGVRRAEGVRRNERWKGSISVFWDLGESVRFSW